ncbi:M14 family metallopeptidase [Gimibacter soli]|uniref:M14-type cytosolic carboxypeptidase n=1 Tax=Gimibacter soli TaxID=3024400 RepID=A0AAE9XS43_9PROT|nr:M14-type cytosolic carboxypeptidase [Gimibacter soli]WCL53980.1 M14-type cytosolic carboxypeptidase [Gimibacter soli]
MIITSAFDSGNIEVIQADSPSNIRLAIRKDHMSDFQQWFHFRLSGVAETPCKLVIENAGDSAYPEGWPDYQARASYDRETWFQIPTSYANGKLTFEIEPDQDSVWFAYFAPYSMERHADLIAEAAQSPLVKTHVLGHTLDGQAMDLIELGHGPEGRKKVWLIARQHPGETMAEWWMEGALDVLLDPDNPVAAKLLQKAHFYIVPNMCPDGSKRGHLRTNAAGVNLNRAWAEPDMETSPEVYLVRQKMLETGVDIHMDVHGDEALPVNFLAGYETIPNLDPAHYQKFLDFEESLCRISPDFQRERGYGKGEANSSDLKKCTDWTAHQFKALAMTLEMPFKDNDLLPNPDEGWSPTRAIALGRSCMSAVLEAVERG